MAIMRALLDDFLSDLHAVDDGSISDITTLVNAVRKVADTVSRMDARQTLTARHVEYLQARFGDILREYVPDDKIDEALRDLKTSIETDESALDI